MILPGCAHGWSSGLGSLEFKIHRTDIADGGVASGSVVEDFDTLEDRALGFMASLKLMSVDHLVLERVPETLGNSIVGTADPTLMLATMPWAASSSLAYWLPRSL